ncbi:hypothetical protein Sango_2079700 [Sesamum angolense]|uniref:Reverse transcriptase Ty1/copia-type domain-containing protein n=1 Tax=Sesamum angolense TaxID=2727404 RepID=A0AAE1WBH7_9LAMI|nr:hypothetical protein Sango_2079700 [Sesamum angolense]
MRHKLDAIEENHTWDVTTLPNVTVRLFLAIASAYEWPLHQLDINNDFFMVSFFSTPVTIIVCSFACTQMLERKQITVSRSMVEAEYRRLAATVSVHIMVNPIFHEHTKHLDIDCHIVRNQYYSSFISPTHVRSKGQLADLFTKSLHGASFAGSQSAVKQEGGWTDLGSIMIRENQEVLVIQSGSLQRITSKLVTWSDQGNHQIHATTETWMSLRGL